MSSLASEMCILNSGFNPEPSCCELSVLIKLNLGKPFHVALCFITNPNQRDFLSLLYYK